MNRLHTPRAWAAVGLLGSLVIGLAGCGTRGGAATGFNDTHLTKTSDARH